MDLLREYDFIHVLETGILLRVDLWFIQGVYVTQIQAAQTYAYVKSACCFFRRVHVNSLQLPSLPIRSW